MRSAIAAGAVAATIGALAVAVNAASNNRAHVRAVVTFVGDSNILRSGDEITGTLTNRPNPYVPVMLAAPGVSLRTSECISFCTSQKYWEIRLGEFLPKVRSDIIVNELGINDTAWAGTATGSGYSYYPSKIDYFMRLLPADRPVLWTNLPCTLEPSDRQYGCKVVHLALAQAPPRWPNLVVLDWGRVAMGHPEYMESPGTDVHYSTAGSTAWSQLVLSALEARFPDPSQ